MLRSLSDVFLLLLICVGDELFTDVVEGGLKPDCDGCLLTFKAKIVTRGGDKIDDSLIGGNASAEEAAEEMEDGNTTSGIDFVLDNKLQKKEFMDKKHFQKWAKKWAKR